MEMKKAVLLVLLAAGCFSHKDLAKNLDNFGQMPYKDISCRYYQKTSVQWKQICSVRVSPLCATNNVTYPNSCVYCFAHIALNFTLHIQHSGEC